MTAQDQIGDLFSLHATHRSGLYFFCDMGCQLIQCIQRTLEKHAKTAPQPVDLLRQFGQGQHVQPVVVPLHPRLFQARIRQKITEGVVFSADLDIRQIVGSRRLVHGLPETHCRLCPCRRARACHLREALQGSRLLRLL